MEDIQRPTPLGLGYDSGSATSALLLFGLHCCLSGCVYGVGVKGFHILGEEGLIGIPQAALKHCHLPVTPSHYIPEGSTLE